MNECAGLPCWVRGGRVRGSARVRTRALDLALLRPVFAGHRLANECAGYPRALKFQNRWSERVRSARLSKKPRTRALASARPTNRALRKPLACFRS